MHCEHSMHQSASKCVKVHFSTLHSPRPAQATAADTRGAMAPGLQSPGESPGESPGASPGGPSQNDLILSSHLDKHVATGSSYNVPTTFSGACVSSSQGIQPSVNSSRHTILWLQYKSVGSPPDIAMISRGQRLARINKHVQKTQRIANHAPPQVYSLLSRPPCRPSRPNCCFLSLVPPGVPQRINASFNTNRATGPYSLGGGCPGTDCAGAGGWAEGDVVDLPSADGWPPLDSSGRLVPADAGPRGACPASGWPAALGSMNTDTAQLPPHRWLPVPWQAVSQKLSGRRTALSRMDEPHQHSVPHSVPPKEYPLEAQWSMHVPFDMFPRR